MNEHRASASLSYDARCQANKEHPHCFKEYVWWIDWKRVIGRNSRRRNYFDVRALSLKKFCASYIASSRLQNVNEIGRKDIGYVDEQRRLWRCSVLKKRVARQRVTEFAQACKRGHGAAENAATYDVTAFVKHIARSASP
jgi:hypothetical protein